MAGIARKVCMAVGKDRRRDGVQQILRVPPERFAPDAIDTTYEEAAKFMNSQRADPATDCYLMEFDGLREKAEV